MFGALDEYPLRHPTLLGAMGRSGGGKRRLKMRYKAFVFSLSRAKENMGMRAHPSYLVDVGCH
jgi:hypothetical protein